MNVYVFLGKYKRMSWINFVSNLLALFALVCSDAKLEEIDKDGYILYCPCMGKDLLYKVGNSGLTKGGL